MHTSVVPVRDSTPNPTRRPLSILVADDYPDAAASMAVMLRLYGHRVTVATSGRETQDRVKADSPDVVLLDIHLPDIDGWEVARWIRKQGANAAKRPFLVALSATASAADSDRSAAAGIDLHLAKGVDPAILVGVLRRFQDLLTEPVVSWSEPCLLSS